MLLLRTAGSWGWLPSPGHFDAPLCQELSERMSKMESSKGFETASKKEREAL